MCRPALRERRYIKMSHYPIFRSDASAPRAIVVLPAPTVTARSRKPRVKAESSQGYAGVYALPPHLANEPLPSKRSRLLASRELPNPPENQRRGQFPS
jgi:hypothetical protein